MESCDSVKGTRIDLLRTTFAIAVLSGVVLAPRAAQAQENWTQQSPPAAPLGRYFHAMAYDTANNKAVMFGGVVDAIANGGSNYDPRTWLWDGTTWTSILPTPSPVARIRGLMAYDSVNHVTVLFGGYNNFEGGVLGDTWVFDGTHWSQRFPATHPSPRIDGVMAYDARNQKVVLHGGDDLVDGYFDDTWVYDVPSNSWTRMFPASSPDSPLFPGFGRIWASMAYDANNQNVVLFGGLGYGNVLLNDTWTWDGANWTKKSPVNNPSPRATQVMGYDPVHSNMVLFGGFDTNNFGFNDTWTWDGSDWTEAQPTTIPEGRESAVMAFDAVNQQVMMFGGAGVHTARLADTWLFGGGASTLGTITINVPALVQFSFDATPYIGPQTFHVPQGPHALSTTSPQALDPSTLAVWASWSDGGTIAHTVNVGTSPTSITGTFTLQYLLVTSASPAADGAVTQTGPVSVGPYYDAGTIVTIIASANPGFQFDSWSGDCSGSSPICFVTMDRPRAVTGSFSVLPNWYLLLPGGASAFKGFGSTNPSGRAKHSMTYDGVRHEVILFGGTNGTRPLNDTWSFDGTAWTEKAPTTRPGPRSGAAMGYGEQTEQAVMFGGQSAAGDALNETWVWDTRTQNWIQMFPATVPPARVGAAMAYDPLRGRVVMFGGFATSRFKNAIFYHAISDTWEWNGANWFRGADGPSARGFEAMTWDATRHQVVLNGGAGTIDPLLTRFGSVMSDTWTYDGTWTHKSDAGPIRVGHGIAYDQVRHNVVLFGGEEPLPLVKQETWVWDGTAWTQVSPLTTPDAREFFSMIYDTVRKEIVLFGGSSPVGLFGDTWAWK